MTETHRAPETQPSPDLSTERDAAPERHLEAAELARRLGNALANAKSAAWTGYNAQVALPNMTTLTSQRAYGRRMHPSDDVSHAHDLMRGRAPIHIAAGIKEPGGESRYQPYIVTSVAAAPVPDFDFIAAATLGLSYGEFADYAPQRFQQGESRQHNFGLFCDGLGKPELAHVFEETRVFVGTDDGYRLLADEAADALHHAKLQEVLAAAEALPQVAW